MRHHKPTRSAAWWSLYLTALLLLAAGCSAPESPAAKEDRLMFEHVTDRLDRGGSYYTYGSNKYLYAEIAAAFDDSRRVFSSLPDSENGNSKVGLVFDSLKTGVIVLGLNEVKAAGGSSVLLEPATADAPNLFRNRIYTVWGDQPPQGLLWMLAGEKSRAFTELEKLPASTVAAFSCELYPGRFWARVKRFASDAPIAPVRMFPMLIEMNFYRQYQLSLKDTLNSFDGIWSGVITAEKGSDGQPVMAAWLSAPAQSDDGFRALKKLMISQKDIAVTSDEIVYKPASPLPAWFRPSIQPDGERLIFTTSAALSAAMKTVPPPEQRLSATAEFRRLANRMPRQGTAFTYVSPRFSGVFAELLHQSPAEPHRQFAGLLSRKSTGKGLFMVVDRESDGLLFTINSNEDLNGSRMIMTQAVMIPVVAGIMIPALNNAKEKGQQVSSAGNLRTIGQALKQYAADHQNQYPTADNAAGLNALIKGDYLTDRRFLHCTNSRMPERENADLTEAESGYLYFGGSRDSADRNLPLACDKPGNHRKFINVLFADGRVTGFVVDCSSAEGIINFLNSEFGYSPEELSPLLLKARKIDQALGYK